MLPFDNSQISEESPDQNSERSDLQDLNHLRQLLPEAINRMDHYSIHQEGEEQGESSMAEEEQEMMIKIREQTHLILELEEKIHYYRTECLRLIEQSQTRKEEQLHFEEAMRNKQESCNELQRKLEDEYLKASHLEKQLKGKDQRITQLDKIIERYQQKKEREVSFRNVYNQQLLSKELLIQEKLIVQLTAKNQKLLKINSFLERELTLSEQKLVSLQIEIQQKVCSMLVDNVSRLKENQNNFSKSMQNYSFNPCIEETKTIKLQNSQEVHMQGKSSDFQSDFATIEKDRLIKADHRYDYKLEPLQSPKPHRKSNRVYSFHHKKREEKAHEHRHHF